MVPIELGKNRSYESFMSRPVTFYQDKTIIKTYQEHEKNRHNIILPKKGQYTNFTGPL